MFQLTAARRRLALFFRWMLRLLQVSTHSRPKTAGPRKMRAELQLLSFNSQPPEDGWDPAQKQKTETIRFNSQPPEDGWDPQHQK